MQAGATTIRLMADIADIQRKFAEVGKIARQTAGTVGSLFDGLGMQIGAALSVGGLAAWIKTAINAADEMSKLAQRAGVAVKDVAGLQLAFRQSGVAAEQFVPIMAKLGVAIANGSGALKAMGVATRNADGSLRSTRQVLGDVSAAFAGYQDGAAKTALAVRLFGEEGARLLPLLNGGAEALDQFDAMALKLGLTLNEQTARQAERFNDTLDLMGQGMQGVGRQVAAELLPTLSGLADQFFTTMTQGDRLRQVAQFLGNILKGLYVVALGVVEVFNTVGKTLGGVAAIVVNVLSGNFTAAGDIARQLKDDLTGGWKDTLAQMEQAWNASGSASFEAMATANAQLRAQAPLIQNNTGALQSQRRAQDEALKAAIEAAKYANQQWDEEFKRIEEQRLATEKRIRDGREMLEQIEFETRLLGMNNTEREVSIAMRELENKGVVKGTEAYEAYAKAIRDAIANRESVKAAQELRRQELDEWQKHWDQVSESFVDALMQGGKSVAEYLKSLFRTLVLRPILAPIGGAFASMFGGGASAASVLGGGATGGTFNILSAAKSAYDAIAGGFTALGNRVAFAAHDIGNWLVHHTTGVLNSAGGTLMQSASSLGAVASSLAGIGAGLGLGNLISGQFAAFGNSNISNVAGTAIGAFFGGPIGAAIGGAIGGLVNRAFGRGPVQTTGTGISGTLSTTGANVRQFQDWHQRGGWFRSDRGGTNYSPVRAELDQFLDGAVQQIAGATRAYAGILGLNADAINGITQTVRISLMGLNADQQREAVMRALGGFGDKLAEQLLGTFETYTVQVGRRWFQRMETRTRWIAGEFVRQGETAGEALARLGSSLATVNQVLDTLNGTLLQTSLAGGDAASQLIDLFGGAEAFVRATSAYYQAFYTEAERAAKATEQITAALASMGMAMPATRAEFRALVESQDLMTDAGRRAVVALMGLAPAFDSVAQAAAEAQRASEQAAAEAQREAERIKADAFQAVDDAMRRVSDAVARQSQAAEQAINTAYESLAKALQAQRQTAEAARQAASESLSALRSLFDFLGAQIVDLVGESGAGMTPAQGNVFLDQAIRTAQTTGYLPEQEQVAEAIEAVRAGMDEGNYATAFELRRDRLVLAARLGALQELAGVQKTVAERQLEAAVAQLEMLDLRLEQASAQRDLALAQNLAHYEAQLAAAQAQVDALKGIDSSVLSLHEAMQALALAVGQAAAAQSAQLAAAQSAAAQSAAQAHARTSPIVNGAHTGVGDTGYRLTQTAGGATLHFPGGGTHTVSGADAMQLLTQTYGLVPHASGTLMRRFAAGGLHPGGVRLVGENGPEIEVTGPARYYSAGQTQSMLGGGAEVAQEVRALREENQAHARAMVQMQARMARMVERWDGNGMPETRSVAA